MQYKIPWSNANISNKEFESVKRVFDTNWLTMGPTTKKFEEKVSNFVGQNYGIAVNSGTAALDVALKAIGIESGDEVIVPAMAYISTATCVLYQNAKPVFVDIEPRTFNINTDLIEEKIRDKTKAIVFMDFGGHPAELGKLRHIAKEKKLFLIEDAAQSLGAERDGIKCGSVGQINTTSFHITKAVTTVEGGMVFTNSPELEKRAKSIRNLGESAKYMHDILGHNYRMTDINAAIGLNQIEKIEARIARRRWIANRYRENLKDTDLIAFQQVTDNARPSYFFFLILVENRDKVVEVLSKNGIETRITYPLPLNKQRVFKEVSYGPFPNAEEFSKRVISLPMFYDLKESEIAFISEVLIKAVRTHG